MTNRKASNTRTQPVDPVLHEAPPVEAVKDFLTIQVIYKLASRGELQTPAAAVQNFICSDQTPHATLASLTGYYQQSELLTSPKTLDLLVTAGYVDDYAFIYFSPGGVQVVMLLDTWAGLCELNGSSMMAAADFLNERVAQHLAAMDPASPFVHIHRLDFHLADANSDQAQEA